MTSYNGVIVTHIMVSDRFCFTKKKRVAISPRAGAHVGQRNLWLKCHSMELARLSGKVVLSCHHVRSANGTAKTMSGRTSTTITFLFGRIGRPRLRPIHHKTQSSNIYHGRAFIRGRSVASRWGFQMRPTLMPREVIAPPH